MSVHLKYEVFFTVFIKKVYSRSDFGFGTEQNRSKFFGNADVSRDQLLQVDVDFNISMLVYAVRLGLEFWLFRAYKFRLGSVIAKGLSAALRIEITRARNFRRIASNGSNTFI
jgi:hypothetical protein